MSATVVRVPRMIGWPDRTAGLIVTRSCVPGLIIEFYPLFGTTGFSENHGISGCHACPAKVGGKRKVNFITTRLSAAKGFRATRPSTRCPHGLVLFLETSERFLLVVESRDQSTNSRHIQKFLNLRRGI